jgi:hypothetical protein
MQSSRSRGRSWAAGWWSCSSGDVGFRSAGSSRWNGAITSARDRSLFWGVGVGFFSFFFILAGVGALGVGGSLDVVLLLLWLTDVPDKGVGVGVIHITVGQFPPTLNVFRIRGPDRSFAHGAQSPQVNFFIPGEEVGESFISSNPGAGILPFPEANLGELQIIAKADGVGGHPLSRPEGRICLLGAKKEIVGVGDHGILPGLQGHQLFRHVPVGRGNWDTPAHSIHLQSLLNVFDGSRKHV